MNDNYVLDACSVIALLKEEQGHDKVEDVLNKASLGRASVLLHKVTLTEITYDLLHSGVYVDAADVFSTCYKLPLTVTDELTDAFIALAAGFKVHYRISFADCFVLAVAKLQNAKVITSDHHEFNAVEQSGEVKFEWIR